MAWLQSALPFIGILLMFQRTTANLTPLQYHLINAPLTWYEAQSFCRVKYTDLATVNNMDDKNELVRTLGGHVAYSWIGLRRGWSRRWMWSDGSGRAHFSTWNDGEPNNQAGTEWCAELSQTGSWNDLLCAEERGFVCYERQQDGEIHYVYYSEKQSWVTSQEVCRSKHTDMAYINNQKENSEIAELVKSWTGLIWLPNTVWFGLFNDAWRWSDGRETSFRYWLSSTQGGGNCVSVAVSQQGRWVDAHCDNKASFVCQGGLKVKKMVIRMRVRADVNIADSTVRDALLRKLETDLQQNSVTDFTLSWRSDKNGVIFQRHEQSEVAEKTGC